MVNVFHHLDVDCIVTSDSKQLLQSQRLVLPGVGSFDTAINSIDSFGLRDPLNQLVLEQFTPVLGICLGMQIMTDGSDEGKLKGLSWISGHATLLKPDGFIKVPHIGWNVVSIPRSSTLSSCIESSNPRFYFVHSYAVTTNSADETVLTTSHGTSFAAGIERDNIMGVQFHPEKSHRFGMDLLRSFLNYPC